jgi:hypothetical protein
MRSPTPDDAELATRPTEPIDVINRPTVRVPRQRPAAIRRAPLAVAAAVAATVAALASYVPVAVVLWLAQLTEGAGSVGGAARAGLGGWLLAHGVPLDTGAGQLGLAPLALTLLALWRLARAGVHTSRAVGARQGGTPRQAAIVAGAVGLAYGVIGLFAALTVGVAPVRALVSCTVIGVVGALIGAVRATGSLRYVHRLPGVVGDGVRTGVVCAALVLGAGAAAAGLSLALGAGDASDVLGAYRTGVAGQAGIILVCLAYAPNAAVWAAAYLLGPGFAVGVDTTVRTTEVTVGGLPAVPLMSGIPHGPVGGLGAALLAVPVVAGMLAGWLLTRRLLRRGEREWGGALGAAALAGPVAGILLGAAAVASSGALGGGRLALMGPVAWQVAAVATVVVALGAVVGAAATRALAGP